MKKTLFLLVLCLLPSFAFADWKMVEPGIDYRREGEPTVHFFRIDPARYRLDLLLASDGQKAGRCSSSTAVFLTRVFDPWVSCIGMDRRSTRFGKFRGGSS